MPLARLGISNGEKVNVEGLVSNRHLPSYLTEYSQNVLSRFGFMRITRKVVENKELDFDELILLFEKAPISVLMKLVSLKRDDNDGLRATPLVRLPLESWLPLLGDYNERIERAIKHLQKTPCPTVHVILEDFDFRMISPEVRRFVKSLLECRQGVVTVGPSIDNLICGLTDDNPDLSKLEIEALLLKVLVKLKDTGFVRLEPSTCVDFFEIAEAVGYENSLFTPINRYHSAEALIEDLIKIDELSGEQGLVDTWIPGFDLGKEIKSIQKALYEERILRSIALAALTFENIPYIRASSRYLCYRGLGLAQYLGANDLGFAALDRNTEGLLKLTLRHELRNAVSLGSI